MIQKSVFYILAKRILDYLKMLLTSWWAIWTVALLLC
jgi:hypothetical protein